MSGTSADGVDCVLMQIQPDLVALQWHSAYPYPEALRQQLIALNHPQADEIHSMGQCARQLGQVYSDAVQRLLRESRMDAADVDLIGCHGQTIRHQPQGANPYTLQIGWADVLTEQTGITTVADFRPRDMAADGQGAPLVPLFHQDLLATEHPRIVLNLGGMANLTWLPPIGSPIEPIAFDTGPGNVLMDALATRLSEGRRHYDHNGDLAAQGQIDENMLQHWLALPYFRQPPPKSTGRELFGETFLDTCLEQWRGNDADLMATFAALTAYSVAQAVQQWTPGAQDMLVFGGGAENTQLMALLQQALPQTVVHKGERISGIPSQALEAMAFGWLALRTLQGTPGNLPSATGAKHAVPLGAIHPGANWERLLHKLVMPG